MFIAVSLRAVYPLLERTGTMDHTCVSKYRKAAEKYQPSGVALLIIAESPPWFASQKDMSYFYFEDNPGNDMFFSTIVKGILGVGYRKDFGLKKRLLEELQSVGVWLTDAVEYPINKNDNGQQVPNSEREEIIEGNIENLLERLENMEKRGILSKETAVILVKETVFNTVKDKLTERGINVLNRSYIPFPGYPGDPNVADRLEDLWKSHEHRRIRSNADVR